MIRRLEQIAPVVYNDQVRDRLIIYALDTHGKLWWMEDGATEGWQAVEGPEDSTVKTLQQIVKGD